MTAPRTVLVCRLSALGDVVLSLPTLRALRRALPDARLEFLARAPLERVLNGVAELDARHGWEGGSASLPEAVLGRAWNVVIDLSGSGRSRRLLRSLRCDRLLRVRKQTLRRLAYVRLRRLGATGRGIVPAVERMLATAAPLGIDVTDARPDFGRPDPPAGGPVLLAPGAGRATKRWGTRRFAALARALASEDGRDVLVLGGAEEETLLREVAAAAGARGRAIAGPDPAELPALAASCVAAVTNDSALLHVAEACRLPVVAVFGPTRPALGFAPRGPRSVVVRHEIDCAPCDLHGPSRCPRGHHRCMEEIPVATVLRELRARLPERVPS